MPLLLAFEAREGELGGGHDIALVLIIIITLMDLPVPL